MKIGYAHVSTDEQNSGLQLAALQKAEYRKLFTDKTTGAHAKRPELAQCLKAGDILVVWKLDRLDRSWRDLITLLDELNSSSRGQHGEAIIFLMDGKMAHIKAKYALYASRNFTADP